MNKIIITGFILCCTILSVSAHDFAVKNSADKTIWYNDVSETAGKNAVEVTFEGTWYNATEGEYTGVIDIPATIKTGGKSYDVIGIGEQAFSQCMQMTSITIPESIEYIREKAFENCCHLNTVNYNAIRCADYTLPSFAPFSFGNMAYGTFVYETYDDYPDSYWSAYDLETINIGENVERIPDFMFYGMGGILEQVERWRNPITIDTVYGGVTSINFAGVPQEIGNQAFRACTKLPSFVIPDGVKEWGIAVFADCDSLKSVTVPDDFEVFPAYCFSGDFNLKEINFPSALTSINYEAFKGCKALTSVELPEGITTVGPSAFRDCENVVNFTLPSTLTMIGGYAFCSCTALPSIDIPSAVEAIGNYAFEDCTHLSSVTLHEGTQEIGNFVFSGCRNLSKGQINVPARMPRIYAQTFQGVENTMTVNVAGGDESEYAADTYWGRFFAPQGIEETQTTTHKAYKVIRDGNVYILRDGKTLDILGNEHK